MVVYLVAGLCPVAIAMDYKVVIQSLQWVHALQTQLACFQCYKIILLMYKYPKIGTAEDTVNV